MRRIGRRSNTSARRRGGGAPARPVGGAAGPRPRRFHAVAPAAGAAAAGRRRLGRLPLPGHGGRQAGTEHHAGGLPRSRRRHGRPGLGRRDAAAARGSRRPARGDARRRGCGCAWHRRLLGRQGSLLDHVAGAPASGPAGRATEMYGGPVARGSAAGRFVQRGVHGRHRARRARPRRAWSAASSTCATRP